MPTAETRKAAVLLTCLPHEQAAVLLSKMGQKQVEAVSIEIAKLGEISGEEQEQVIQEFATANPTRLASASGGLNVAKTLLEQALGKNATATLDNVRQSIDALPFGFLQKVDSQNLATFLIDEHPQTIALILSRMTPQQASAVISALPPERQLSVVRRIANMQQTSPEIIQEVERGLELRMSSVMSQRFETMGGTDAVAEILNVIDRPTERSLLENLAQEDPDLVDDIRRKMFIFDDITKFADRDIQTVLKNVENSQWAMALKGASDELKQKILNNMSKRASTMLQEEMDFLGPVRQSSVEQVQQQIVDIIRRLQDSGEITLQTGEDQERFVE